MYTSGDFEGTTDFDPGPGTFNLTAVHSHDIFISKLDANGNFVWAKSMGGTDGGGYGFSIAVDAAGNVYNTGNFFSTVDFDPGPGVATLTAQGGEDAYIAKLDANGDFVWAKAMGGISFDVGLSICVDAEGHVFTTGFFWFTVDFDPGPGTFELTAEGNSDIFICKLDANGDFAWAKSLGGPGNDQGNSIALDDMENIYCTGRFEETVDFDPGLDTFNFTSAGAEDIFIHKMSLTTTSLDTDPGILRWQISPNPSTATFHLRADLPTPSQPTYTVLNQLGQVVWQAREEQPLQVIDHQIDLSTQPSGIYHLRISDGSGSMSRQLVVVR